MKSQARTIRRIRTIAEYHILRGWPEPLHPLIGIIDIANTQPPEKSSENWILDFYQISLKRGIQGKIKYGQNEYDFDEGIMFFMAPGQVFRIEASPGIQSPSGWLMLFHPDILSGTTLARTIAQFEFFQYSQSEALFLSQTEESTMMDLLGLIRREHYEDSDAFSKDIIVSQIGVLLNYANRYYNRQFRSRAQPNGQILERLEDMLVRRLGSEALRSHGLPSVQEVARSLNVTPNYLSGLLRSLTGQSTQQLIQSRIVELAKYKLASTEMSVREIARELGFDYSQSFNKFFKSKTNVSPLAFRRNFQ
ncbi:MAG: helix-turn-helix transcriptional regulator [Leptospiraceae bacterium]|nr:helix-turn-helix transcriptional regulator [Leptospiraceae bacterium]